MKANTKKVQELTAFSVFLVFGNPFRFPVILYSPQSRDFNTSVCTELDISFIVGSCFDIGFILLFLLQKYQNVISNCLSEFLLTK